MEFVTQLWLPILVSSVVLFVASSIAWTVLTHHDSDFQRIPQEDPFMASVRGLSLPAGSYIFPHMTHKDAKDPAAQEKYRQGPRGKIVVWDMPHMGRNLGLTFLLFLVIAAVVAYAAWVAMGPGIGFTKAFRVVGTIGVLVFASSGQLNAIWFPRRTFNDFLDGIVYGLLMGAIFGYFWPSA